MERKDATALRRGDDGEDEGETEDETSGSETKPSSTFEALVVSWESASQPDRLRLFKERDRAEIIAAMPPEFLAELSDSLEQQLGRLNSKNDHLEDIANEARDCSALLAHPMQNRDDIRKKLARIRSLAGAKGKAWHAGTKKSNAQLDRSALARGLGIAGPTGEKFPTLTMTPSVAVEAAE
jgi:hypothetical protein